MKENVNKRKENEFLHHVWYDRKKERKKKKRDQINDYFANQLLIF